MNICNREFNGFYNNSLFHGDTNRMYFEKQYWHVLEKAGSVGDNLCQSNNDYKSGGIFHGLFLAPNIKYCLTIIEFGTIEQHQTFKEINDSKKLLDCSQNFKMIERKKN